jgi:cyanophycinase-like exopeptidase
MVAAPGPLALVGSGEYLPSMLAIERSLLEGRPPRYVQIPTAASAEGADRLQYWIDLGRAQAARLGVEAAPLVVKTREEANDPAVVKEIGGAGLIYLSGGNPRLLADTLRDTALLEAIVAAWHSGAALAGCSAGAMAMAASVPDFRGLRASVAGFGVTPRLQVLPHFDKMGRWMPDFMTRPCLRPAPGVTLVGIDEETALVSVAGAEGACGEPIEFEVRGRQSAWILGEGRRQRLAAGDTLRLPAVES